VQAAVARFTIAILPRTTQGGSKRPSVLYKAARSIACEIAIGIITENGRPHTGELVETIGAIGTVDVVMAGPGIKVSWVGPRDPRQLSCKIRIFKILNEN
jgi:hypothetical protein